MVVLCASVNFQFTVHGTSQRTLWQHTFYCFLDNHFWLMILQLIKSNLLDTTWETRMRVVSLSCCFVTSYSYFLSIDNDDVIASINVRSVFCLMLAT
ncbi:hypothetical protein SHAQ108633_14850 [Shewanella aquimarina]